MAVLIRVTRIVLLLVLAVMITSFVIGMVRPETGPVEKITLGGLIVVCFALGAGVTSGAKRLQKRLA